MPESVRSLSAVFDTGDLDELVHDACSRQASTINNEGVSSQECFLNAGGYQVADLDAISPEDLDGHVADLAAHTAADINNEGVDAQIRFLLQSGYTPLELLEARPLYEVICGNIGTVYHRRVRADACVAYDEYVALSLAGSGRAAQEPVTLFKDGEPEQEYQPDDLQS